LAGLDPFIAYDSTPLDQRAAAAQQTDDEQHEGDDEQHMDECADRVRPDDSQQPGEFPSRPARVERDPRSGGSSMTRIASSCLSV
jgi:hypothetical protein